MTNAANNSWIDVRVSQAMPVLPLNRPKSNEKRSDFETPAGGEKKKSPASYSPDTDRVQLQLWTPFHLQQLSLKELQSGRVDEESARFIHSFIKVRAVINPSRVLKADKKKKLN